MPSDASADQPDTALSMVDRYLKVAQLYVTMGAHAQAEHWYRKLADEFPDQQAPLAMHLAAHEEVGQAITMTVENLRRQLTPDSAVLLARILLYSSSGDKPHADAEALLSQALANFPDQPELTFAVSNLRLKQQRLDEGLVLLERTVQLEPGHILGWNNMAAVLAERPERRDEALECIERALAAAGYDLPTLLDTKGVVLLQQGDATAALPLLETAARQAGSADPRFYFHLAQARHVLGDHVAAADALEQAERHGLRSRYLTLSEQQAYADLTRLLAVRPASNRGPITPPP
jgi:tetratricopeptide (TPR) repeat protein